MNEADAPTGVPIGPPSRLMQSESISLFPKNNSDLAVTLSADDTAAPPATLANGAAGVTSCHNTNFALGRYWTLWPRALSELLRGTGTLTTASSRADPGTHGARGSVSLRLRRSGALILAKTN